jgi:hypothetical protein
MKPNHPQPDGGFKICDRVKLVSGTLAWKAEMTLQGKIGEVTECRGHGRVSVLFDTGRLCSWGATPGSSSAWLG